MTLSLAPSPSLSLAAHAAIPAHDDPFYGLLTSPPGQWGLVWYGSDKGLVMRGDEVFLTRSLNLLSSYCSGGAAGRGHLHPGLLVKDRDQSGAIMVPVSEERLKGGLTLWFYGQLYPSRRLLTEVLDEDGDVVESSCTNEEAMLREATNLAAAFYATIEGDSLGTDFIRRYSTVGSEHAVGGLHDRALSSPQD